MKPRTAFFVSLALAALIGFGWSGAALYKTAIDLSSAAFPAGAQIQAAVDALGIAYPRPVAGVVWMVLGLLVVAVSSFWLMRRAVRSQMAEADPGRRSVLSGALAGGATALVATGGAAGLAAARGLLGLGNEGRGWLPTATEIFGGDVVKTHESYPEEWKGSRVQGYRTLGRTGWKISDIVVGGGRVQGEKGSEIVRMAFDRGVNYVDTSPDYSSTGSEQAIAAALKGRRDKVFLATKFCTPRGHLGPLASVVEHKRVVEESLRRLQTDYVDLVHQHSCDEVERIESETMHEAFDRLKEEGKVRFLGFSSHTPNLIQVAEAAIENGRFDVMMLAYHHGIWPAMAEVIGRSRREQDMGIVAMKTLKGARHNGLAGFREHSTAYSQAALKWVLSNADVSAAVISFFEFQHVDEYLFASGAQPSGSDLALLGEYDRQIAGTYCTPHCGACLESCPEGVPINDVLRHRMYFEDYGNEKEALRLYAGLETNAEACASCSGPCLGSCPIGVTIPDRMRGSHDLLTLS
ncbi:MAG: aldo/keto reductase [Deltaproteobacteria bacterium]|nr:aldo/keto reductase [Deltaproteobacteria bacterium]MBW2393262.1 aldo/keto reductase [Deltaproteobacteria bacterium]